MAAPGVSVFNPGAAAGAVGPSEQSNAPAKRVGMREQCLKVFAEALADPSASGNAPLTASEVALAIEEAIFELHPDEKTREYRTKCRNAAQGLKGPRNAQLRVALFQGVVSGEDVANLDAKALEEKAKSAKVPEAKAQPSMAKSSPSSGAGPSPPGFPGMGASQRPPVPLIPEEPGAPISSVPGFNPSVTGVDNPPHQPAIGAAQVVQEEAKKEAADKDKPEGLATKLATVPPTENTEEASEQPLPKQAAVTPPMASGPPKPTPAAPTHAAPTPGAQAPAVPTPAEPAPAASTPAPTPAIATPAETKAAAPAPAEVMGPMPTSQLTTSPASMDEPAIPQQTGGWAYVQTSGLVERPPPPQLAPSAVPPVKEAANTSPHQIPSPLSPVDLMPQPVREITTQPTSPEKAVKDSSSLASAPSPARSKALEQLRSARGAAQARRAEGTSLSLNKETVATAPDSSLLERIAQLEAEKKQLETKFTSQEKTRELPEPGSNAHQLHELAQLEEEKKQLEAKLADRDLFWVSKTEEQISKQCKPLQEQIAQMADENQRLTKALAEARDLAAAKEEHSIRGATTEANPEGSGNWQKQVEEMRAEKEAVRNELIELQGKYNSVQEEHEVQNRRSEEDAEALRTRAKENEDIIARLQRERDNLRSSCRQLECDKQRQQETAKQLAHERDELVRRAAEVAMSTIPASTSPAKEEELKNARQEITCLKKELAQSKNKFVEDGASAQRRQREIESAHQDEITKMKLQHETLQATIDSLKQQLETARKDRRQKAAGLLERTRACHTAQPVSEQLIPNKGSQSTTIDRNFGEPVGASAHAQSHIAPVVALQTSAGLFDDNLQTSTPPRIAPPTTFDKQQANFECVSPAAETSPQPLTQHFGSKGLDYSPNPSSTGEAPPPRGLSQFFGSEGGGESPWETHSGKATNLTQVMRPDNQDQDVIRSSNTDPNDSNAMTASGIPVNQTAVAEGTNEEHGKLNLDKPQTPGGAAELIGTIWKEASQFPSQLQADFTSLTQGQEAHSGSTALDDSFGVALKPAAGDQHTTETAGLFGDSNEGDRQTTGTACLFGDSNESVQQATGTAGLFGDSNEDLTTDWFAGASAIATSALPPAIQGTVAQQPSSVVAACRDAPNPGGLVGSSTEVDGLFGTADSGDPFAGFGTRGVSEHGMADSQTGPCSAVSAPPAAVASPSANNVADIFASGGGSFADSLFGESPTEQANASPQTAATAFDNITVNKDVSPTQDAGVADLFGGSTANPCSTIGGIGNMTAQHDAGPQADAGVADLFGGSTANPLSTGGGIGNITAQHEAGPQADAGVADLFGGSVTNSSFTTGGTDPQAGSGVADLFGGSATDPFSSGCGIGSSEKDMGPQTAGVADLFGGSTGGGTGAVDALFSGAEIPPFAAAAAIVTSPFAAATSSTSQSGLLAQQLQARSERELFGDDSNAPDNSWMSGPSIVPSAGHPQQGPSTGSTSMNAAWGNSTASTSLTTNDTEKSLLAEPVQQSVVNDLFGGSSSAVDNWMTGTGTWMNPPQTSPSPSLQTGNKASDTWAHHVGSSGSSTSPAFNANTFQTAPISHGAAESGASHLFGGNSQDTTNSWMNSNQFTTPPQVQPSGQSVKNDVSSLF